MSTNLGLVRLLGANAVGEPGQRHFCLYAQSTRGSVLMWIEKEQFNSLSLVIDRALAEVTEGQVLRTEAQAHGEVNERKLTDSMPAEFPRVPDYEFQVGQIRLSLDEAEMQFQLRAIPLEIMLEQGGEPQVILKEDDEVSINFTLDQGQQLARSITRVTTAGRPVCPLCHAPLDGKPHSCVRQNGHKQIIRIEGTSYEE